MRAMDSREIYFLFTIFPQLFLVRGCIGLGGHVKEDQNRLASPRLPAVATTTWGRWCSTIEVRRGGDGIPRALAVSSSWRSIWPLDSAGFRRRERSVLDDSGTGPSHCAFHGRFGRLGSSAIFSNNHLSLAVSLDYHESQWPPFIL
jgi:hypothetical protein